MNDQLIQLTKDLIAIPSVTGDLDACNEVLDRVKKELPDLTPIEFEKDGVKSLLFHNQDQKPDHFRLLLNAHLDVVPAQKEQFTPTERGGRIYGRGAQDMKSGGAALILAFKELAKTVEYPLGLQIVTDEETGGFRGAKVQFEQGVTTDFIVAGESTNLQINNYAKGIIWARITTTGKSAHGAYLWQGENAIDKLRLILNDLRAEFPVPEQEVWKTTLNIARVETTNTAQNKVPADATALVDIRIIPEDRPDFTNRFEALVGDRATIEYMSNEPTQETPDDHPDILQLKTVMSAHGRELTYLKTHGGSDVRFYSNAGSGAICMGPIGGGLHTDDEWVDLTSIQTFYKIMCDFIKTLS